MSKDFLYEKFQIEEYMVNFLRSVLSTEWDKPPSKEVVFLGDSIIRDYDLNRFFPNIKDKLFNCGVSGITSEGLFNIIKQGVVRHKPKVVLILVGTNDMSEVNDKRNEEIIFNIARIICELKIVLKKLNVVLISILPCDEARYGKNAIGGGGRENSRIMKINSYLSEFENHFKDLIYVNAFDELADKNGNIISSYTHDGIHLTLKGYEKLTALLKPIIQDLIKKDWKNLKKFTYLSM